MKRPDLTGSGPGGERPLSTGSPMKVRHRLGFRTSGMRGMPLDAALETIAAAGYALVEFCMEHPEAEDYRGDLFGLGISAVSYHGKKDDPGQRKRSISLAMEKAGEIGASVLVLGSPAGTAASEFIAECHWTLDRLPAGVRPAWEPEPGTALSNLAVFLELAQMLGPRAGLNLDFGHAFLDGLTPGPACSLACGRLLHVHVEDVRRRNHTHLLPGEGDFPWGELMPALDHIRYPGPLVVDLFDLPPDPARYISDSFKSAIKHLGVR